MEPIAEAFEDHTFRYTQLARHGMLAIYEQRHKEGNAVRYEVIRIRERPAHTWPNGIVTPPHEAYPGATRWGMYGFTCFSLRDAEQVLAQMQKDMPDAT